MTLLSQAIFIKVLRRTKKFKKKYRPNEQCKLIEKFRNKLLKAFLFYYMIHEDKVP